MKAIVIGVILGTTLARAATDSPLPQWVVQSIKDHRAARSQDTIEEQDYMGQRAFEFISGTKFDTGDEHVLIANDGRQICQFGGIAGHVTRGTCDIDKIRYVRTLYQPPPKQ